VRDPAHLTLIRRYRSRTIRAQPGSLDLATTDALAPSLDAEDV
jgi:hypothetical protein